jgi:hypothetical protein
VPVHNGVGVGAAVSSGMGRVQPCGSRCVRAVGVLECGTILRNVVAGSGCARADMKMRSGKVIPLCSINQGGKANGCERQSLETAPRKAERGRKEGRKVLRRTGENWAKRSSSCLVHPAPVAEQPRPTRDKILPLSLTLLPQLPKPFFLLFWCPV